MGRIKGVTLALAGLLAASMANAATYDINATYCSTASIGAGGPTYVGQALDAVNAAIIAATFKSAKDESNMLLKVTAAKSKAGEGKWGDVIYKLDDITTTAAALANAAKPKLDSDDGIAAAAYQAAQCVSY